MPDVSEWDLQRAFCIFLDGNPDKNGNPRTTPALATNVIYWHTPNGGERRNAFEGKRLHLTGVKAGVHDLLFLRPTDFGQYGVFGLLFGLELKKPGGPQPPTRQLSDAQQKMHPRLIAAGMAASAVVDNLADAKAFCARHGLIRSL